MLKIKDNVDLKELEKYGLKPVYRLNNESTGETAIDYLYSTKYECECGFLRLIPRKVKKILFFTWYSKIIENNVKTIPLMIKDCEFLDIDLLYDLIKDGLVEKVED